MLLSSKQLLYVALSLATSVLASKDSSKVLRDLSAYEALYVKYERCTWSPYYSITQSQDQDDQYYDACMSGMNEDFDSNLWYVGATGCDRANVAFSLYGLLKGDDSNVNACSKGHYINSFFTVGGLEAWVSSMQSMGKMSAFSVLSSLGQYNRNEERRALEEGEQEENDEEQDEDEQQEEDQDDEEGEQQDAQEQDQEEEGEDDENDDEEEGDAEEEEEEEDNDDDEEADYDVTGGSVVGSFCLNDNAGYDMQNYDGDDAAYYGLTNGETVSGFEGASSIGIGCMAGSFRLLQFNAAFCPRSSGDQVLSELPELNKAMGTQECIEIYNSASEDRSGGLYLLQESRACDSRFSTDCPDPFGLLSRYESKFSIRNSFQHPLSYLAGKVVGVLSFVFGTLAMIAAACVFKNRGNSALLAGTSQKNTRRVRMSEYPPEEAYYYPDPIGCHIPTTNYATTTNLPRRKKRSWFSRFRNGRKHQRDGQRKGAFSRFRKMYACNA